MIDAQFLHDVEEGLSAPQKYLSSKYFYDENGSQIFQEIMAMAEYYLTRREYDILVLQAKAIVDSIGFSVPFDVIELGAGDGEKTLAMLKEWKKLGHQFRYLPNDLSYGALEDLLRHAVTLEIAFEIIPLVGDHFECLRNRKPDRPQLFLFLGANIGNYAPTQAVDLLTQIKTAMAPTDRLMIGFDLKKDPEIIQQAYDDPYGITKRFNLNLLFRINNELGGHFDLDQFDFKCTYNPETGEVHSYLVSLQAQTVRIDGLEKEFSFAQGELIHTELSKKYDLKEIEALASACKLTLSHNFIDRRSYFVDSLWRM